MRTLLLVSSGVRRHGDVRDANQLHENHRVESAIVLFLRGQSGDEVRTPVAHDRGACCPSIRYVSHTAHDWCNADVVPNVRVEAG